LGEEEEYKKYIFAGDAHFLDRNHGAITVRTCGRRRHRRYGGFGPSGLCHGFVDIKHPKPYGHTQYEFNAFGMILSTRAILIADAAHPRLQNIVVGGP